MSKFVLRAVRLLAIVLMVGGMSQSVVLAGIVGIAPLLRAGYPDFSQLYADNTFTPLTGHASWWGEPALPGTCRMCGPTTAAGAAFWFADLHGSFDRLSQVQIGSTWVDASAGTIIEQLALNVGLYEGWDPNAGPFPGTSDDQNYIKGQQDFYSTRGIQANFDYLNVANATADGFFSAVLNALENKKAVEMSNTGHWFAIAGIRSDQFLDNNGNDMFDFGDNWINDYNNNGLFDNYFYVNNPWPGHASQGWQTFYASGGDYYVNGDTRMLDSVVFVSVVPEPGSLLLVIFALSLLAIPRHGQRFLFRAWLRRIRQPAPQA